MILSPNDYKRFLKHYRIKHVSKGELILIQGEVPPCTYLIKKGIVKTYNLTSSGEEKPIIFDIQGEVFPFAWTFGRRPRADYYYEAFTDCELYCIPREDLIDFIKRKPEQMFKVLESMVNRSLGYQMRVNALEQSKASDKVLNTLHFLCLRYGQDLRKDLVKIQLPLTQQDLANFMGLTRETTGIELKKLQRKGIISYRRQNYIVKTNKLDQLLDEDYDPVLASK
jgi:CRP/FNR family transcriptional regulator